jgi:hypothetical protein
MLRAFAKPGTQADSGTNLFYHWTQPWVIAFAEAD